jgi:hypothetical protein
MVVFLQFAPYEALPTVNPAASAFGFSMQYAAKSIKQPLAIGSA